MVLNSRQLSIAAPVIFLLLWSGGFTVAKIGIVDASPIWLLALRYFCVVVLLIPLFIIFRPTLPATPKQWFYLSVVGFLIQVVYFGCAYLAFGAGASASVVALITCLQPILVALIIPRLTHETVSGKQWVGLLMGLAGALMVILGNASIHSTTVAGIAFSIIALIAITAATTLEKRFGVEHHPITSNLVQYSIGFVFTLPLALLFEDLAINWTMPFALSLAYLVLGNSLLAISLLLMMVRRGEAAKVTSLFFLVPPITALIAWIVLGEKMTSLALAGLLFATLGVMYATRSR